MARRSIDFTCGYNSYMKRPITELEFDISQIENEFDQRYLGCAKHKKIISDYSAGWMKAVADDQQGKYRPTA